jgi:hypothetical protein
MKRYQSNTTLFQEEYHFIQLHVAINTETSSGIRKHNFKTRQFFKFFELYFSEMSTILCLSFRAS